MGDMADMVNDDMPGENLQEMDEVIIPHGGSGTGGSYWGKHTTGCLIKADLTEALDYVRPCWAVKPLIIGTMFHAYAERWFSGKGDKRVKFVDSVCAAPADWDDRFPDWTGEFDEEAYRIFQGFLLCDPQPGKVIATELQLEGEAIRRDLGLNFTGQIDLLVERDGVLVAIDFKTRGSRCNTGNPYEGGNYELQRIGYVHAARLLGYPVESFEWWGVTKTKTVNRQVWQAATVQAYEVDALRSFLQSCRREREERERFPLITECHSCPFRKTRHCKDGL